MTTGTWLRPTGDGVMLLNRLPRPCTLLVRVDRPPVVAEAARVDVRPGPIAVHDGERRRGCFHVEAGGERRTVPSRDLAAMASAVADALAGGPTVVRFGDRAACRRLLPAPAVRALERGLVSAVEAAGATLVTWTREEPGAADRRTYAVVVDGPAAGGR